MSLEWLLVIGISIFVTGMVFIIIGSVMSENGKKNQFDVIAFILFPMALLFIVSSTVDLSVEDTYKKAVKYNPYEMRIRYELRDSVAIPADTVYVLKSIE